MVIRVKTSFCGAVTASRGQVLDIPEEQAQDLIQAGYVVPVATEETPETPEAEESKEETPVEEAPAEPKKAKGTRKKA